MKALFHSITQYTGFSSKHYIRSRLVFSLLYRKGSQTKLIWQGRAKKKQILIAFLGWVFWFGFLWNSRSHAGKKRLKNQIEPWWHGKYSANEIMPKPAPITDIQWNDNDKSSKKGIFPSGLKESCIAAGKTHYFKEIKYTCWCFSLEIRHVRYK